MNILLNEYFDEDMPQDEKNALYRLVQSVIL